MRGNETKFTVPQGCRFGSGSGQGQGGPLAEEKLGMSVEHGGIFPKVIFKVWLEIDGE